VGLVVHWWTTTIVGEE